MGFKSLFKVRKPGNGNAVQKAFERFTRAKISISNKGGAKNGKKVVK